MSLISCYNSCYLVWYSEHIVVLWQKPSNIISKRGRMLFDWVGVFCFAFGVLFLFRGDKGKAGSFRQCLGCGVRSCVWAAPLWKGGKVPVSSVALRDLVFFPCCCLGGLTIPWCSLGFLAGVEQEECEPPWASRCAKKGKVLELISPHIAIKRITSLTVSGTIYRQIPFLVCWGLMFMPAGFSVGGFLCGN